MAIEGKNAKAKILCFRVYGTQFYNYDPNISADIRKKGPLIIDNFSENNYSIRCYFGEVPEEIHSLKYYIDALGLKNMENWSANKSSNSQTLDEYFNELKKKVKYFEGYVRLNTIIIEKEIDPFEYGFIDDSGEVNTNKCYEYLRNFYKSFKYSEIFNKTSLCLLTKINPVFFNKLITSEEALIVGDKNLFSFPSNYESKAEGWTYCCDMIYDIENVADLIKVVNSKNIKWLDEVSFWRIAMLEENDNWKKFSFGFFALELLINMNFNKFLKKYDKEDFREFIEQGDYSKETKDRILVDKQAPKIRQKTEYIFSKMCPEYDFEKCGFGDVFDKRNDMSHGRIKDVSELPLTKLEYLLNILLMRFLQI